MVFALVANPGSGGMEPRCNSPGESHLAAGSAEAD